MDRITSVLSGLVASHAVAAVALVWLIDSGIGGATMSVAFDALIYERRSGGGA